jgi:Putative lumazine-binding
MSKQFFMKQTILLATLLFVSFFSFAQTDKQQVERACLDYIEGFYEADTIKMLRSIKPELYKIGLIRRRGDTVYNYSKKMTLNDALSGARKDISENKRMGKKDSPKEVVVLDILKVTAVARVKALWGYDYLLLSKINGKWMIEEVLWEGN